MKSANVENRGPIDPSVKEKSRETEPTEGFSTPSREADSGQHARPFVDLRKLSEVDLIKNFKGMILYELKVIARVVEYIAEIDRRELHLKLGFPSLWEYLVRGLGYTEGAAHRRLLAARALRDNQELKEKLETGTLKISQVAKIQSAIKREEKISKEKISPERRLSLFAAAEKKTTSETEILIQRELPRQEAALPKSEVRYRGDESVVLTLKISPQLFSDLNQVKDLYSHIAPGADWVTLLELMSRDVLKKRKRDMSRRANLNFETSSEDEVISKAETTSAQDVFSKAVTFPEAEAISKADGASRAGEASRAEATLKLDGISKTEATFRPAESEQRKAQQLEQDPKMEKLEKMEKLGTVKEKQTPLRKPIPAQIRREIFSRDQNCCQFPRADGSGICGSRFQLEVDHIVPVHAGGSNDSSNLRILCANHNKYRYRAEATCYSECVYDSQLTKCSDSTYH